MQLPAPSCQVMSSIPSMLTFPKIFITFRVFQFFGSYGNAITGLMSAVLRNERENEFEKKIKKLNEIKLKKKTLFLEINKKNNICSL